MASQWYSPDCIQNEQVLSTTRGEMLTTMASVDQQGHSVLEGALSAYHGDPWETTVGLSLLRRAVVQFEGVRYLCERSSVQSASLPARALFETMLATRVLVYGARRYISGLTPLSTLGRERRARLFRVDELRREIYRRKAALDGRFGRRFGGAKVRAGVQEEIDTHINYLERRFPAQHRTFGPLRCFPKKGKPQYHDEFPWFAYVFSQSKRKQRRSVRALSIAFGWGTGYEMLYDAFSGFGHARGLNYDTEVEPGSIAIRVPHAPDDFDTISMCATRWQLLMLSYLSRTYHPPSRQQVHQLEVQSRPILDALAASVPLGIT